MRAQELGTCGRSRFAPLPFRMSIFQQRGGAQNPLRALRVTGSRIFDAVRIVENNHNALLCNIFVSNGDWNWQVTYDVRKITSGACKLLPNCFMCITKETKMKPGTSKLFVGIAAILSLAGWLKAGPPTVDDVGDLDSFGKNAVFMGAESGFITLQTAACTPTPTPTPGPPSVNPANTDQCFQITDTSVTTPFDAENSCRINLPGDAAKSIIYPVLNFFYRYHMNNTTGVSVQARFQFTANITIVSDVLNDPSCIDPNTSAPCGGQLTFQFTPNRAFDDRHLDVGETAEMRLTLTRAGNAGISKANLIGEGLPPTLVDKLFHKPMTLRLNVVGTAKNVDLASITDNMRLFGDH